MAKVIGQLAHHYDPHKDYTGWLASRKMNGNAFLWDGGITRGMLSNHVPWSTDHGKLSTGFWSLGRSAGMKVMFVPPELAKAMPPFPTQGEVWHESDNRQKVGVCRKKYSTISEWDGVRLLHHTHKPFCTWGIPEDNLLLGIPEVSTYWSNQPAAMRTAMLQGRMDAIHQTVVTSKDHFNQMLSNAVANGWEGLMLVNPNAKFENDRSHNVLKVKPEFETEGKVIGYKEGVSGKRLGGYGGLLVSVTWDEKVTTVTGGNADMVDKTVTFGVCGLTDDELAFAECCYPIGSTVRFSFAEVADTAVPQSCNVYRGK